MAGVGANVLTQQLQSRLSTPSAVLQSPNGSSGFKPQHSSSLSSSSCRVSSSASALKTPLNHASTSGANIRSSQFRSVSCAAASPSTMEPGVLFSSAQVKSVKPSTLYDVLGISHVVTDDEIKAAFRRIAKQVHPDQAPPDKVQEFQRKFLEAHEAYSVLKDPQTRAVYNFKIRNSLQERPVFRAEDWRRPQWRGCNWETDQCWTC